MWGFMSTDFRRFWFFASLYINKVRKQGELTHRIYRAVSLKKLEKQYSQMEAFVNENKFWQGQYPIFDNSDFDLNMD